MFLGDLVWTNHITCHFFFHLVFFVVASKIQLVILSFCVQAEYELCQEMVALLPARIAQVSRE